jgi:hypothetical protein
MTARRLPPPALLLPALVSLALTSSVLGACSFGGPPATSASRASQATLAACRERAEDVYVRQNRDLIYANDTSSTPYSAGPSTGLPMHGLSSQFAHQQVIDDCVRNTGPATLRGDGPTTPAGPAAAGAPAGPPP